jgi:hypothetical protein
MVKLVENLLLRAFITMPLWGGDEMESGKPRPGFSICSGIDKQENEINKN